MKLLLILPLMIVVLFSSTTQAKSPILLINGITGAELDVKNTRFSLCNSFGRYRNLWVNADHLLKCGVFELSMQYDPATGRFSDMPGVTIRVPGFGDTDSVETLGGIVPYLRGFVNYFVDRGYVRGRSIRAAPYDWRLAADELERRGYYRALKGLVETMYTENGAQRVTLVVHSMGGLVSHHFLTSYVDQTWKDKHIHAWVTLSGAWSGGVAAAAAVVSGKEFGDIPFDFLADLVSTVAAKFIVPIARNIESLPWLLPRASVFKDMPLITTPGREYTASDYEELFNEIQYTNGHEIHQNLIQNLNDNFAAPNVPTYCYYGVGVPTPERYIYGRELDDSITQPLRTIYGAGDGTVNLVSSQVCQRWAGMRQGFQTKEYNGVSHIAIVSERRVLDDIAQIVYKAQTRKRTFRRA